MERVAGTRAARIAALVRLRMMVDADEITVAEVLAVENVAALVALDRQLSGFAVSINLLDRPRLHAVEVAIDLDFVTRIEIDEASVRTALFVGGCH
jgi:hypothetical protein